MKISLKISLVLLFGLLVGIFFYLIGQFFPCQFQAEKELFIISKGTSGQQVIDRLKEEGFIRNPRAFEVILKHYYPEGQIQAGGYFISKRMSAFKLVEILTLYPAQKWVTMPEGQRKEEIAEVLQKKLNWTSLQKEDFLLNCQEGYLFPDTYLLDLDYSVQNTTKRLEDQFKKEFQKITATGLNNLSKQDIVILASLVQREAAGEKEMPLVAGILLNRLREGMKLDVDATLQYYLGKPGDWWPKIIPQDREINSSYNTYLKAGLPPGPICNSGRAAMMAVLFPQETDFLYYIHNGEGKIFCAETYSKHLQNIERYLKK